MKAGLVLCGAVLLAAGCSDSGPKREARPASPAAGPLKIIQFYASPSVVAPGEPAMLCYGVDNARAVRLEPPIEEIRPLYNRCLEVKPRRTAVYTLIATGVDGGEARQSVTITVRPDRPPAAAPPAAEGIIETFVASAEETTAGGLVTLCYALRRAEPVRLEPGVGTFAADSRKCVNVRPAQTTTYTLLVEGGQPERAKVTVRVR